MTEDVKHADEPGSVDKKHAGPRVQLSGSEIREWERIQQELVDAQQKAAQRQNAIAFAAFTTRGYTSDDVDGRPVQFVPEPVDPDDPEKGMRLFCVLGDRPEAKEEAAPKGGAA